MADSDSPGEELAIPFMACSICLNPYDQDEYQAKFLPGCHHSFCSTCLEAMYHRDKFFKCPTCRGTVVIPETGIKSLQANFYVLQILEAKTGSDGCRYHNNQLYSFFCKTCQHQICRDCVVLNHKSEDGHEIQDIKEATRTHRHILESRITKAENGIASKELQSRNLGTELSNLEIARDIAMHNIKKTFEGYISVLNKRCQQLSSDVNTTYERRAGLIQDHHQKVKHRTEQLQEANEECRDAIQSGRFDKIFTIASKMENLMNIENCSKTEDPENMDNYIEFDVKHSNEVFDNIAKTLGKITVDKKLPSNIKVVSPPGTAGFPLTIKLTVRSYSGEAIDTDQCPLAVDIRSPADVTLLAETKGLGDGKYEVTFVPKMSGDHRVLTRFHGKVIEGAEVLVSVDSNDPVMAFGKLGSEPGDLNRPTSITVAPDGDVYVTDYGNCRIQRFTPDVQVMKGDSRIATLADTIQAYTPDGKLISQFVDKEMKVPYALAINSRQHIIVSDFEEHKLFVFSKEGRVLKTIGGKGAEPGKFYQPTFISVMEDDSIIVSDAGNKRIQILDSDGKFVRFLASKRGSHQALFKRPSGVAVDQFGHILVADCENNIIKVFHKEGGLKSCIESLGNPLDKPRGIAISEDGFVFVIDWGNHCVKKFKYYDPSPAEIIV
ncbi:unnamed protein product [Owenia fusiformis]|uniref:Tripartite motif-containing protein 2-like n=1 Tax=Owenia fusiformis TaxID=6347 RepID=A0A8S4PFU9_OWEFU|nr:unnamed protein product [Owenia fusiformis]